MHKIKSIAHLENAADRYAADYDPTSKDGKITIESLVNKGWDSRHPIVVYPAPEGAEHQSEPRFPFPETFTLCGVTVKEERLRHHFEAMKKGKVEGCGNSGDRRFSYLPYVNSILEAKERPLIVNVPSVNMKYKTDLEREIDNISHNNLASKGKVEISWRGPLRVSAKLHKLGIKKAEIANRLSLLNGMSQKTHAICVADTTWPELDVVGNTLGNVFDYESLVPGELRKLTGTTKKKGAVASEEDALQYLSAPKETVNSGSPVNKGSIKEFAERTNVQPFKICLRLAAEMDTEGLEAFKPQEADINRCWNGLTTPTSEFGKKLSILLQEESEKMAAKLEAVKLQAASQ